MNLGNRIRKIRKSKNFRQEDFAKILSTSNVTISDWERSRTEPDVGTLVKIAEIGGKSLDWLLTGKEHKHPHDKVGDKILDILTEMTENQKFEILRMIEKEKLLADLLEKKNKK